MCTNCSLVEVIAFITTCIALAINATGVFSKTWWLDTDNEQHGLFTVVNCTDSMCRMAEENTSAWIVVAQVTSLIQLILLVTSIFIQIVGCLTCKQQATFLNFIVLSASCFFSLLHIFILIHVYSNLMDRYPPGSLPADYVYFQTLPAGLNAVAGTVTIPPLVTMLFLYTKEKKAKRDAIKEAELQRQREDSVRKRSSLKGKKPEEGAPEGASNA